MSRTTPSISRRDWMRLAAAGGIGASMSGWMQSLADTAAKPRRACILLWMNGGPSQIDTFDPKPGHANGGPVKAIDTRTPGIQISEYLPKVAEWTHKLALVRSMSTKEGDHSRATYFLRTGNLPGGAIQYPTVGSLVSKELGDPRSELPNFVSVAPFRGFSPAAFAPGFLGPSHAPLVVAETNGQPPAPNAPITLKVDDLATPAGLPAGHAVGRTGLLEGLDAEFAKERPDAPLAGHRSAYERAVRLMRSEAGSAFDLDTEPDSLRDAYGRTIFGQGCLLARRLVERGVPFVEVSLTGVNGQVFGWDTHGQNFTAVKSLCGVLDPAWATLMSDLDARGLLETTTIVWMGEFGRTPKINQQQGRDHFADAWSVVLGGGGIRGGQVVGKTTDDGMKVADRPVTVPDLMATVCKAVGIDPAKQNDSGIGRPIRIVDKSGTAIEEVLS